MRRVRTLRAGGESVASLMATFTAFRATIYRALQSALNDDAEVEVSESSPTS